MKDKETAGGQTGQKHRGQVRLASCVESTLHFS